MSAPSASAVVRVDHFQPAEISLTGHLCGLAAGRESCLCLGRSVLLLLHEAVYGIFLKYPIGIGFVFVCTIGLNVGVFKNIFTLLSLCLNVFILCF